MSAAHTIAQAVASVNSVLTARGFPPLDEDQVAALGARGAPAEALGMLDELLDRVHGISHAEHRIAVEAVLANTRLNAQQRAFIEARLLQIVNTVGGHVVRANPFYPGGRVPPKTLTSFGELHEYCDANQLGGLCDGAVTQEANQLFSQRTDVETVATQEWMDISDRTQTLADEWIVMSSGALESSVWHDRTHLVGQYRQALPAFGELDVEVPVGWWDITGPNDDCPSFACGHYRLWVGHAQGGKSEETPRFVLELLGDNMERVRVIMATDDWIAMEACVATLGPSRDCLALDRRDGAVLSHTQGA